MQIYFVEFKSQNAVLVNSNKATSGVSLALHYTTHKTKYPLIDIHTTSNNMYHLHYTTLKNIHNITEVFETKQLLSFHW